VPTRIMMPLILLSVIVSSVYVLNAPQSLGQGTGDIVSGILEEFDLSRMKGMIRTDLGKPVFFAVSKPELFKGLTVGERITIQVDEQGRVSR